jgi:DNA-binding beta-propeller fold protein YncE
MGAAVPVLLASNLPGPYQVVHGWPELPEGFAFGQVSGVGADSHNHVFVFHRGDHPIMCFEGATGKLVASWGDGMFRTPHGLAVDVKDNVWVTDVGHHQVFKFSHDGELLMTIGAKDVPGLDGKHFNQPTDIAVAQNGEFYVSDGYGNSRVAKFSAQGEFLLDWGRKGDQPGEFDTPHGIALDAQGRVYVADRSNARVQVFDGNGKFLSQWKSAELGRPWDITIGPDGYAYVVDGGDLNPKPPDRGRVVKLDLEGHALETWGRFGKYDGQIYWGHALAVAQNGDVYVTDVGLGMRVQKFVRKPGR